MPAYTPSDIIIISVAVLGIAALAAYHWVEARRAKHAATQHPVVEASEYSASQGSALEDEWVDSITQRVINEAAEVQRFEAFFAGR